MPRLFVPQDRLEEFKEIDALIDAQPVELAVVLAYLHSEILKLRHPEVNPAHHLHAGHADRFDAGRRED